MKRFLALTLSVVMMLSMFVGCSSKEETPATEATTAANGTTADNTTVATSGEENVRTDFIYGVMNDIVGFDPPD